jgi:outer membrane protein OmpA-like peptidoglycan-associated protein
MSFNLIESAKSIFNNEFTSKASALTGESEMNIKTAMSGIIPSVLTGLLSQAGSGNPQNILNMVKNASSSGILGNLTGALGNSDFLAKGTEMLKGLFGDKLGNVGSLISGFSGIRESSASSLMSIAGPAALGVLGNHVYDTNMNAGGLLSFLNSQKDSILSALPSGLNLAGALGLGSLTGLGSKLSSKVSEITGSLGHGAENLVSSIPPKSKVNWLPLVIGAIVLLLIILFLFKGCNGADKTEAVVTTDTARMDSAVVTPVLPDRQSMKVKLPDGVELNAFKGGIEDQLVVFLNDPASVPGKDMWFDFDNLNFKTGSADITEESLRQVQNITAILKAYPKVKIKIGGYTDKTGDSVSNLALSRSRATAVVAALKTAGGNASQIIGAEGYGSQFAKVDKDASDDERKKDRRIAVSVRAK